VTGIRILAVAVVLAVAAWPSTAVAKTRVFSSGSINRPIPDTVGRMGVEIGPSIKIEAKGRVRHVSYRVRISHPKAQQLELGASHIPSGGVLRLANLKEHGTLLDPEGADFGAGGYGCDGASFTVFDDQAPMPIQQGAPPFLGPFAPVTPLAAMNGTQLRGRWYLDVLDFTEGGTGTIVCWQVKIRYTPAKKHRSR
jgi:hypothetical protein